MPINCFVANHNHRLLTKAEILLIMPDLFLSSYLKKWLPKLLTVALAS